MKLPVFKSFQSFIFYNHCDSESKQVKSATASMTTCKPLPQLSDMGLYTCVATSSSGETSWSAYLDVRGLSRWILNDSGTTNVFEMTSPGSELADIHSVSLIFFSLLGQSRLTS